MIPICCDKVEWSEENVTQSVSLCLILFIVSTQKACKSTAQHKETCQIRQKLDTLDTPQHYKVCHYPLQQSLILNTVVERNCKFGKLISSAALLEDETTLHRITFQQH